MKIDLTKMILFLLLGGIAYMIHIIVEDVQYLTKLVHAYISLAMDIVKN
jgi:hypothetical protein|tara:strand:+ start:730 stop:876 length:147 start_codon:yes stop_codon:yes gene_type:complete